MPDQDRILLTGAAGFIGQAVVRTLIGGNAEVHGTLSPTSGTEPEHTGRVVYHRVDLLDASATDALVREVAPTHLVHLAWDLSPGELQAPHHVEWVQASLSLLSAFHAQGGRRAVLTGSCFEYDFDYGYCTEGLTPERPATTYGRAKNALSRLVDAYGMATDLSVVWARIFFVYGPGEADHRLVPYVIDALMERRPANCTHGRQIRDYLHVDDVAAALTALLRSEVQGAVNVGSGTPVTLRAIVDEIADQLGGRSFVQFGARDETSDEPPLLVANPTRLRTEVGWEPSISLSDGIRDTIRARTPSRIHHSTADT